MKILKMISLLAIMAVAVFMTSCEQESIILEDLEGLLISEQEDVTESTDIDLAELTQKIESNENFQEIKKLHEDVLLAIEQNTEIEDITLFSAEQLIPLTEQLYIDIPALNGLDNQLLETLLFNSFTSNTISYRDPCVDDCREDLDAAWADLLDCVGSPSDHTSYNTWVAWYNWAVWKYNNVLLDDFYDCRADC